jgi:hypothetical protein
VATKNKSLSKKIMYITKSGSLTVITKKNRHLLWYDGKPMCKRSDSAPILLQPGDSISIGNSDCQPWLDFHVKSIPIPVTPEEQTMKNCKMFAISPRPTSRKRLYFTHPTNSGISADSSEELVFESQTDYFYHTQSPARENCKRRKTNGSMSPRRLLEGRDIRIPVQSSIRKTDYAPRKRQLQQTDFSSSSSDDGMEKAWMTTRRRNTNAGIKGDKDSELSTTSSVSSRVSKTGSRKDNSVNQQQLTQESNETSSVLSLPQCPTWNDEEEEDVNTGTQGQEHNRPVDGESRKEETAITRGYCLQAFGTTSKNDTQQSQQHDDDDSSAIQFASSLSLAQWRLLRQQHDSANPTVGRVRRALAGLIVAQRARGADGSAWLPTLLEGAVVQPEVEST